MRKILFKAKAQNGQWIHGYYRFMDYGDPEMDTHTITVGIEEFKVDPETVCQYTGKNDRHGEPVFEKDVMRGEFATGMFGKSVRHQVMSFSIHYREDHHYSNPGFKIVRNGSVGKFRYFPDIEHSEVVGNLIDNPELISEA